MGAIINASTDRITGTIAAAGLGLSPVDEFEFFVWWYPTTDGAYRIFGLGTDDDNHVTIRVRTGTLRCDGRSEVLNVGVGTSTRNPIINEWNLFNVQVSDGSIAYTCYTSGATPSLASVADTLLTTYDDFVLGNLFALSNAAIGTLAECAIYTGINDLRRTTIWNGGAGAAASEVDAASLLYYYPLREDSTQAVGTGTMALTDTSITYDGEDHPFGESTTYDELLSVATAYWKLDETTGTATDYTGNGHTGTWQGGGTFELHSATTPLGKGIHLDTPTDFDYIKVPTHADLVMGLGIWSIGARVKADVLNGGGNAPTVVGVGDNTAGEWMLRSPTADSLEFIVKSSTAQARITGLSIDTWYSVLWTYDGANLIGYLDGIEFVNDAVVLPDMTGNSKDFHIGVGDNNYTRGWDGLIDEVGVWKNRVLTPAEVALWAAGPATTATGETSRDTALDTVGDTAY